MPATTPNIAKGRVNELVRRVDTGDPAASRLVVMLLQDTGIQTLDELRDHDSFASILAATNTECAVASYARLVLGSANVATPTLDDVGNQQTFDYADLDFGTLEAGENIQAVVVGYTPDQAGGDDTDIIPIHVTRADTPVATNGEIFHYRTPNGVFAATEPA